MDIFGIKTYRMFDGKRFKFKDQTISKEGWRRKKKALRAEGYLVRTHTEQILGRKKYQIYMRKP